MNSDTLALDRTWVDCQGGGGGGGGGGRGYVTISIILDTFTHRCRSSRLGVEVHLGGGSFA